MVNATEGYGSQLPQVGRRILPLYSLMIATEPLPDATWERIGIEHGQTFTDFRNLIVYGQRTADNRFAFGGRGARYHLGSAIRPGYDRSPRVREHLIHTLFELFPDAAGARITHHWGGPLGVPRDWHASVGYDRDAREAWAGGYVGDGLSTTNLAGRTLADLLTGSRTELTALPWVGHRSPRWEPEPLRFAGANAGLLAMESADLEESRHPPPLPRLARRSPLSSATDPRPEPSPTIESAQTAHKTAGSVQSSRTRWWGVRGTGPAVGSCGAGQAWASTACSSSVMVTSSPSSMPPVSRAAL